jgi:hypothetical protein
MAGRGPLVTNLSKRLWSTMAVQPDAQRNPPQDPKPFHACVDVQAGAKVVNEMERTLGRVSVQTGTLASTQAGASSKQITVRVAVRSAHFLLACVRSTCLRPGPAPRPLRAPLLALRRAVRTAHAWPRHERGHLRGAGINRSRCKQNAREGRDGAQYGEVATGRPTCRRLECGVRGTGPGAACEIEGPLRGLPGS